MNAHTRSDALAIDARYGLEPLFEPGAGAFELTQVGARVGVTDERA